MISSTDSETLETSLACRKSVPNASDCQALRELCIKNRHDSFMETTAWAQEHFPKSLSHLPRHVKALPCKDGAICEHDPEILPSSLNQSSSKMNWSIVENCSVVRQIKSLNSFWKQWMQCYPGLKRRGDHPACYQRLHFWWYAAQECWAATILHQTRVGEHSSPKVQQLVSSVPRCLQTVVKRRGDATQCWTFSFSEMCCCHQIQDELIILMKQWNVLF